MTKIFDATIGDALQGCLKIQVRGRNMDHAYDEAMIAAREHGCDDVVDIELFEAEQGAKPKKRASASGPALFVSLFLRLPLAA